VDVKHGHPRLEKEKLKYMGQDIFGEVVWSSKWTKILENQHQMRCWL